MTRFLTLTGCCAAKYVKTYFTQRNGEVFLLSGSTVQRKPHFLTQAGSNLTFSCVCDSTIPEIVSCILSNFALNYNPETQRFSVKYAWNHIKVEKDLQKDLSYQNMYRVMQMVIGYVLFESIRNCDKTEGQRAFAYLMRASQGIHTKDIQILVERRVVSLQEKTDTWLPRELAASSGNPEITRYLMQGMSDEEKKKFLTFIIASKNLPFIKAIVKEFGYALDTNGLEVLHLSILSGDQKIIKYFLNMWKSSPKMAEEQKKGFPKQNGITIMHQAALKNNVEIFKWLESQGYNPQAVTKKGIKPIHMAAYGGALPVVLYLLRGEEDQNVALPDGRSLVHFAAQGGLLMMRYLVEHGWDWTKCAERGNTVLHYAARAINVRPELVQYLLSLNEGLKEQRNQAGLTPYDIAVQLGKREIASLLVPPSFLQRTVRYIRGY